MAQEVLAWGGQPAGGKQAGKDLLATQLEGLFSDVQLPEQDIFPPRSREENGAPAVELPAAPPVPRRETKPRPWLKSRRMVGALGTLGMSVALALWLVKPEEPDRPGSTAPRPVLGGNWVRGGTPAVQTPTFISIAAPPVAASPTATFVATATSRILPPTPTLTPPSPTPTQQPPTPTQVPPTPTTTSTREPTPTASFTPRPEPSLTPPPTSVAMVMVASVPTRLRIPTIGLETPIEEVGYVNYQINGQLVTTWAVPSRFAAGWHHNSARPGQGGNVVLNGHQGGYGGVFQNLAALRPGDEIIVYVGEVAHYYQVAERHVLAEEGEPLAVRTANANWIMPTQDERLTLVTCAPDSRTTHRLIVVARPAEANP